MQIVFTICTYASSVHLVQLCVVHVSPLCTVHAVHVSPLCTIQYISSHYVQYSTCQPTMYSTAEHVSMLCTVLYMSPHYVCTVQYMSPHYVQYSTCHPGMYRFDCAGNTRVTGLHQVPNATFALQLNIGLGGWP